MPGLAVPVTLAGARQWSKGRLTDLELIRDHYALSPPWVIFIEDLPNRAAWRFLAHIFRHLAPGAVGTICRTHNPVVLTWLKTYGSSLTYVEPSQRHARFWSGARSTRRWLRRYCPELRRGLRRHQLPVMGK